jgi:hypothetical protein
MKTTQHIYTSMKARHLELAENEEEKTHDHFRRSAAVPIALIKPSAEVEDDELEPAMHIPSYLLCFAVLFVLVGLTLTIFSAVSNSSATSVLGVPLWVLGVASIVLGLLGVYCMMSRLRRDADEEKRNIIPPLQDQAEWSRSLA